MWRALRTSVVLALCASPAYAQAATVAIFAPSATDANTATPLATPVTYTPTCNLSPKFSETPPILNPNEGVYDDPANPTTRDCKVLVDAQIVALPIGKGYRAAVKVGTQPYGPLSSAFERAAQVIHPCDGIAAAAGSVVSGSRTLTFCNGTTTPITGWALYTNGVRALVTPTKGTANTAGLFAYTVTVTVPVGVTTYELAAVNQTQEAAKSATFTLTAQAPIITPGPSTIRSVQ